MVRCFNCAHLGMFVALSSGALGALSSYNPISFRSRRGSLLRRQPRRVRRAFDPRLTSLAERRACWLSRLQQWILPGSATRLGNSVGSLTFDELRQVDATPRLALAL